jgi:hypothetical protein
MPFVGFGRQHSRGDIASEGAFGFCFLSRPAEHFSFDRLGDETDSVVVGHDQVACEDLDPIDRHRPTVIYDLESAVYVERHRSEAEDGEVKISNGCDVTNVTVANRPDSSARDRRRRQQLSPERRIARTATADDVDVSATNMI